VIKLWETNNNEYDLSTLPEKFIIATANQTRADLIIDKLEASKSTASMKVVRLSHSNRDDINKKYSLDKLAKIDVFNKNRDTSFQAQFEES
jgi:hypothetical protein